MGRAAVHLPLDDEGVDHGADVEDAEPAGDPYLAGVGVDADLGEYFDTEEGLLVLRTPEGDAFGLRAGDVILISTKNRWQAYYYWDDDAKAPAFARTVDIHRQPGYDPVELHIDMATKSIPLNATLIKGSHGTPPHDEDQRGVLLSSQRGVFVEGPTADTDVADIVLRQFGI